MEQTLPNPSKRSGALDLLRFLAITVVFFGHYIEAFNYANTIVPDNLKFIPWFRYGTTSIIVFYMVSGYTVTMTSVKRDLKDFFIVRLSRLYPLFWVSCFVGFLLARLVREHTYLARPSLKTFLANLTMIPGVLGSPLLNPVFHTLTIELFFYFLIAIIILFKLWNRMIAVMAVLLALCLADGLFLTKLVYVFITPFLAGMLFYLIKIKYDKAWKLYGLLAVNYICSLMTAIPLAGPFKNISTVPRESDKWAFMAVLTAIYLIFLLITLQKIRIKETPLIQVLGRVVYPLYLFHIYFLFVYWYFRDTIQPQVLLVGIFLVLIAVSWLLHTYVEKPFVKLTARVLTALLNPFQKRSLKLHAESTN